MDFPMVEWQNAIHTTVSIEIGDQPTFQQVYFPISKNTQCLRFCGYLEQDEVPFSELVRSDILKTYLDFPSITADQKQFFIENHPDPSFIETIPLRIHFYDSKDGFRGRWTPETAMPMEIGIHHSSPGCIAGPIPPGNWKAVVLCPACWHGSLILHVIVDFTREWETTKPEQPSYPIVESTSYNNTENQLKQWFIGEIHHHTNRSQSTLSADKTIQTYQELGYKFLTLSDHDMPPVTETGLQPEITIHRGQELEMFGGHALLLGTREFVRWYHEDGPRNIEYLIQETHIQGGLFCIAHPFALQPGSDKPSWQYVIEDWNTIDLIEVWPGLWKERFPEILKTLNLWDSLLQKGYRVMGVAGKGGATIPSEENIEKLPKFLVMSESAEETDILAALKQGHAYMTIEPAVSFWTESRVGGAYVGGELRIPAGEPYLLRLNVTQLQSGFVRIKSNRGILCEMPLSSTKDSDLKFTLQARPTTEWFRVEIYKYSRPIDELLALTNPIFVRGMVSV
jgi:hypothetical protein